MKYKLSDICETITDYVANGSFKTLKENVTYNEKKDFARLIRFVDYSHNFSENGAIYVPEHSYNFLKKSKLFGGELVLANVGTIGEPFLCPNLAIPMTLGPNAVMLRTKPNICDQKYLYYFFKTIWGKHLLNSITSSSAVPKFNKTDLRNQLVDLPDLQTQKKIVRILSALDQKIELNNQLDLTIHNNLNAIFEDWFIRKNYNGDQSKWRKEKLGNFVTINRGLSYKGQFLSDSGTPMINLGNIMPGGIFRSEKNKYYTGEYKNKVVVKAGDLVMANTDMTQKREVLGTPLIVPSIYDGDVIFSHHIYSIKSEKIPTLFLYYLLLRKDFSDAAGGGATGTTVLFLPKDIIENFEFVLPDDAAINRFVDIAKRVLQRRNNIMHENTALETIRDALLPRLMSGEIDLGRVI